MNKRLLYNIFTSFGILIFLTPLFLKADTLVLLGYDIGCSGPDCGFNNLLRLANVIMNFIIEISIPISAALFIYSGFLYVTARDDSGQVGKARDIFKTVAIGFTIILSAWLIVYTLVSGLVDDNVATGFLQYLQ